MEDFVKTKSVQSLQSICKEFILHEHTIGYEDLHVLPDTLRIELLEMHCKYYMGLCDNLMNESEEDTDVVLRLQYKVQMKKQKIEYKDSCIRDLEIEKSELEDRIEELEDQLSDIKNSCSCGAYKKIKTSRF
jgi:predicted RNase H-like nuclease (RuvC/YqgF family)